jgi:hypothetical protein
VLQRAQLASPPPLPPRSASAPRPASALRLGGGASLRAGGARSENTPPPALRRFSPSFGALERDATPAPSCSGLSRTPRRPVGAASAQRATQRQVPPATTAAAPHAPHRRATLSGGSDADVAAVPPVGPSAPSVSAGDVAAGLRLRWAGGGDGRVAAAAGSDSGDPRGRDGDEPLALRACDEDWLARTPPPSSAGDAPPPPVPVPALPRGLEAGAAAATPARSSGGGDTLLALLMRAVRFPYSQLPYSEYQR